MLRLAPLVGGLVEALDRHRAAKQVALELLVAKIQQEVVLPGGLDPFGDDLQVQVMGELRDRAGQGGVLRLERHIAHKRCVNFQRVDGQLLQVALRRITGAKIVQRQLEATALQLLHLGGDVVSIIDQAAFGQLQLEPVRIGTRTL